MKSFSFRLWVSNRLLMMALFVFCAGTVLAQEEAAVQDPPAKSQTFHLVYIAQDESMLPGDIQKNLASSWNDAVKHVPTIFYLSRGSENPVIVEVNLKGGAEQDGYIGRKKKEFDELCHAMEEHGSGWGLDGPSDKQKILELLREHPIVDSNGEPLYKETIIVFHVGQDFWKEELNESVIAALFFELNFKRYENYRFLVYCPYNLKDKNDLFGSLNPDNCNDKGIESIFIYSNNQKK